MQQEFSICLLNFFFFFPPTTVSLIGKLNKEHMLHYVAGSANGIILKKDFRRFQDGSSDPTHVGISVGGVVVVSHRV